MSHGQSAEHPFVNARITTAPLKAASPSWPLKERFVRLLAALCLFSIVPVVASFAIQYRSSERATELREEVRRIKQIIEQQMELQAWMTDAALAMGGFVFMGEERFLEAVATATQNFDALLVSAGGRIQHPSAKERFARAELLMREQLRLIREAVELRQKDDPSAGATERQLEILHVRKILSQEVGELLKEERHLLATSEAEALREERLARAAVLAGSLIALGFLGLTAASLGRESWRRRLAERLLHEANAALEARVAERTAQLREQQRRLQAVVDTTVEGIITIDERGIVDSMNAAAERMFGYQAGEVIGHNVSRLMPSPYHEHHDGYLARFRETGHPKIIGIGREVAGQRKDGTTFPLDLAVSEVQLGDRRIFTGLLRDLTERKRLEAAVTSSAEQEGGRIARDLHDGLGQELGGALFLGKLVQRDLKERGAVEAERVAQINTLVENALADVRAISRGLYPVSPGPDGLMTALQYLADRVTREGRVECLFDTDSAVLLEDSTVGTHLYRIAQEAVNNALRHSGTSRIDIRLAATAHRVEVSIRDHGKGLSRNPPANGGLGLQTMKHRAQVIGGQLSVQNAADGGVLVACAVARVSRRTTGVAPAA